MRTLRTIALLAVASLALGIGAARSAETAANASMNLDWPGWRGPSHNGVAPSQPFSWKWPKDGPKKLWSLNIGAGYASPILCDNRVFAFGRMNGDWIHAIDAVSGAVLWKTKVGEGRDEFVSSTPCTDGILVYSVTADGNVTALDAKTGNEVWKVNLVKEYKTNRGGFHGIANSPLLVGDILVLAHGVGLNKTTGKLVWQNPEAMTGGHTSPISCMSDGKPGVLMLAKNLMFLDPLTGKNFWSETKFKNPTSGYMDPLVTGDEVLVLGGAGGSHIKFNTTSAAEDNKDVFNSGKWGYFGAGDMANPVKHQGYLYVTRTGSSDRSGMFADNPDMSASCLQCFDAKTFKNMWTQHGVSGTPILCDGKMIFQGQWGDLRVIEASPDGYKELANAKIIDWKNGGRGTLGQASFSTPILSNGRIYMRSYYGELVCVDVSKDASDAEAAGERDRIVGELYTVTGTLGPKEAGMPDYVVGVLTEDAKVQGKPSALKLCATKHNDNPGHLEKIAGMVGSKAHVTVTGTILYDGQMSVNEMAPVDGAKTGP
ncbi:MAG: PQQ-binding-like beta-propeller repeat protein [Planctomycetes bacterium]|nr:PQQ-binding-like beta-propeller repeat protein [Planctomycetota bacterium]